MCYVSTHGLEFWGGFSVAAGGALLGAVGLDALIVDETERRQEAVR